MSKYTIKYGQSIIDVSLILYNDISYVFNLINWNPAINNINSTSLAGIEIYYEPILVTDFKYVITDIKPIKKNVTIKDYQSIFDLSLQIYGTVENAFDVVKLAGVSDITETEMAGIIFTYDYIGTKIPKYLDSKKISIATKYPFTTPNYRITENDLIRSTENDNLRILE